MDLRFSLYKPTTRLKQIDVSKYNVYVKGYKNLLFF